MKFPLFQRLKDVRVQPKVVWEAPVGQVRWRNNIVVDDGKLYLGTCGEKWNHGDPKDGIVCLTAGDGAIRWAYPTGTDVNGVTLSGGLLFAGTDSGDAIVLDAESGELVAREALHGAVLSKPHIVQVGGFTTALFFSQSGEVLLFDLMKREFAAGLQFTASPQTDLASTIEMAASGRFYVGTSDSCLYELSVQEAGASINPILELKPETISAGRIEYEAEPTGLQSLVIHGQTILVSYSRNTYGSNPPLLGVDRSTGEVRWRARRTGTRNRGQSLYGNARTSPAIWKGLAVTTFASDPFLRAYDLTNGVERWAVRLDDGFFQNWASVIVSGDRAYVPRIDGVVSIIDLNSHKIVGAVSVESANPGVDRYRGDDWDGYSHPGVTPDEHLVSGIAATPSYGDGALFVGTVSGRLLRLAV